MAYFGSVLLLDDDGTHLKHGAAPNLAKEYIDAIDGIRIGPNVGSCGTAAFRREPVIVTDIMSDPLWEDFRELVKPMAIVPVGRCRYCHMPARCWASLQCIRGSARTIEAETELIDFSTRIAGIAMERKLAEERIHFMANHDTLTGLPNRALLGDRLSQAILHASATAAGSAWCSSTSTNFKLVNDTLGHNAGDVLLKTVASRMIQCVRSTDTVVRLGGDEFVIVLVRSGLRNAELIAATLKRDRAAIAEADSILASIICERPPASALPTTQGMARTQKRCWPMPMQPCIAQRSLAADNVQFYTPELNARTQEKFLLQEELRNAWRAANSCSSISLRSTFAPARSSPSRR